jgi:hypothetical protein
MARLPSGGATLFTPSKSKIELERALAKLKVGKTFDAVAIEDLWFKLSFVNGKWLSELSRIEVSPVAKALRSIARNLSEASRLLSGLEDGLRNSLEIAVASEVTKYLALDPTVGTQSKASKIISAFHQDASRIAHVCMVARAGLPDKPGDRGRPVLNWYDDFTALLLEIARKAGVTPSFRKDRVTLARSGWLFDAAQALEPFLDRAMRSPSLEACGKRLERSLKNLRKPNRQKSKGR